MRKMKTLQQLAAEASEVIATDARFHTTKLERAGWAVSMEHRARLDAGQPTWSDSLETAVAQVEKLMTR